MTFVTQDDRDADDACHDLDGKDLLGARVRVEMARERGRGGDRFGDRGFGGRSPPRRGGNPPGKKTPYRIIVENLSSRTSWQVKNMGPNPISRWHSRTHLSSRPNRIGHFGRKVTGVA